ncbi:MAG: TolB family protein, partial [Gammaproteobacteria bacterium]
VWAPAGGNLAVHLGGGLSVLDSAGTVVAQIDDAARPAWSPDGTRLAFARIRDGKGVPMIRSLTASEEVTLAPDIEPQENPFPFAWSPNGTTVVYGDGLHNLESGAAAALPGIAVGFSPDGRLLMVVLPEDPAVSGRSAHLLDMSRDAMPIIGLEIRPAPDNTPPWHFIQKWIAWTPDGRVLAYMDPDEFRPRVRVYDTVEVRQTPYRDIRGEFPNFAPDGKNIAFAFSGKVWVLAIDGSALADIAQGSAPQWQP